MLLQLYRRSKSAAPRKDNDDDQVAQYYSALLALSQELYNFIVILDFFSQSTADSSKNNENGSDTEELENEVISEEDTECEQSGVSLLTASGRIGQ